MLPVETNILTHLSHGGGVIPYLDEHELEKIPLGSLSAEFHSHLTIETYCKKTHDFEFALRIALEQYLSSERSTEYLEKVKKAIIKLCAPCEPLCGDGLQNKAAGTYLIPLSPELIRQIYEYEDTPLTQLFSEYFPIPTAALFKNSIPQVIQEREAAVLETIKKIPGRLFPALESFAIKSQRYYRMQQRKREEVARILLHHKQHLMSQNMSEEDLDIFFETTQITSKSQLNALDENNSLTANLTQWANTLLQDANSPYQAKCEPELLKRLNTAAQKVSAFSTVTHITSEKALTSIFNEGLYGRRSLKNFYMSFEKASLWPCDILNGDADAVCLGPKKIDPKARGSIAIEFNLDKLTSTHPSAFYKQRDLEYYPECTRIVKLGNETISFSHTELPHTRNNDHNGIMTYFQLFNKKTEKIFTVQLPKASFIAYDFKKMHAILTLNFFRFIDEIPDKSFAASFYQKINHLSDEQLVLFLEDLENNMTDTAEINFYGAHKIDFSSIISIKEKHLGYTLKLSTFISALNQGAIDELRKARENIPNLFTSYRFLDYLLSQVRHSESLYYLDDLRKQCDAPKWVQYSPLLIPEGFEITWAENAPSSHTRPCS